MLEIYVHGESLQDYLIGFVLPEPKYLKEVAAKFELSGLSDDELLQNSKINQVFLENLTEQGKKDGLNGMEQVKKIEFLTKPLLELGIITSTMKVQRHVGSKVLKDRIKSLYESN